MMNPLIFRRLVITAFSVLTFAVLAQQTVLLTNEQIQELMNRADTQDSWRKDESTEPKWRPSPKTHKNRERTEWGYDPDYDSNTNSSKPTDFMAPEGQEPKPATVFRLWF